MHIVDLFKEQNTNQTTRFGLDTTIGSTPLSEPGQCTYATVCQLSTTDPNLIRSVATSKTIWCSIPLNRTFLLNPQSHLQATKSPSDHISAQYGIGHLILRLQDSR